jgi:hypothetical protein
VVNWVTRKEAVEGTAVVAGGGLNAVSQIFVGVWYWVTTMALFPRAVGWRRWAEVAVRGLIVLGCVAAIPKVTVLTLAAVPTLLIIAGVGHSRYDTARKARQEH